MSDLCWPPQSPFCYDCVETRALSGTAEVLSLTTAAKRQVASIKCLRFSRCTPADRICAGLQLTANATTGKKRIPRVFGFIVGFGTGWRLGLVAEK
jgi:hypothetical protein